MTIYVGDNMKRALIVLLSTVVLTACSSPSQKEQDIQALEESITDLERQINELESDNEDLKQKVKAKEDELNQMEKE